MERHHPLAVSPNLAPAFAEVEAGVFTGVGYLK